MVGERVEILDICTLEVKIIYHLIVLYLVKGRLRWRLSRLILWMMILSMMAGAYECVCVI